MQEKISNIQAALQCLEGVPVTRTNLEILLSVQQALDDLLKEKEEQADG